MQEPTDVLALQGRASTIARRVVDAVRPDQLGEPTPCSEWDVRALLNHIVGLQRTFAAAVAGEALPDADDDVVGDDPKRAFVDASQAVDRALRGPGVLDQTFRLPWGEMPGQMIARVLFLDLTIHSWDLATATGQPRSLDPELCGMALTFGRSMLRDEFRRPGGAFGPEVAIAADAPICDRLAAFYGRRP
jgi:uncharacterized protein (TIGR03086 family)